MLVAAEGHISYRCWFIRSVSPVIFYISPSLHLLLVCCFQGFSSDWIALTIPFLSSVCAWMCVCVRNVWPTHTLRQEVRRRAFCAWPLFMCSTSTVQTIMRTDGLQLACKGYVRVRVCVCVCACTPACMYACTYVCMYVRTYVPMCV